MEYKVWRPADDPVDVIDDGLAAPTAHLDDVAAFSTDCIAAVLRIVSPLYKWYDGGADLGFVRLSERPPVIWLAAEHQDDQQLCDTVAHEALHLTQKKDIDEYAAREFGRWWGELIEKAGRAVDWNPRKCRAINARIPSGIDRFDVPFGYVVLSRSSHRGWCRRWGMAEWSPL